MEAQTTRTPGTEAIEVFRELGLATPEQRAEVLAQEPVVKPASPVRYVIRLSNSSQPAPLAR